MREQLARLEGFGQVVVGAHLQTDHPGPWHPRARSASELGAGSRADLAAHFDAVNVWERLVT
jgi:hypothetical protein